MFVDEVEIKVAAGDGGRGAVSFRREKYVPRGGPDGGNGGHGGSVFIVASPHLNTLVNFRYHPEFEAERGRHGQGSNRTGANGRDLEIEVPIGTIVYEQDETTGDWLQAADLAHEGDRIRIAEGGRGGMGNAQFVSSTNRAPRKAQPGLPGQQKALRLHLKLLADVGLVGYPNAGKSTLISRVSAARPKIADYPFTTLTPNLGVVTLSGDRSFVVADVPGLIEGAHTGHGLGDRFLKHLERTRVLIHVVDVSGASGRNPADDLDVLRRELGLFDDELARKPQVVAANKMDAVSDPALVAQLEQRCRDLGLDCFRISAVSGQGVPALLEAAWRFVSQAGSQADTPGHGGTSTDRPAILTPRE